MSKLNVEGNEIQVLQIDEDDYISLTDMVRKVDNGTALIEKWLRNKNTIEFLGIWEEMYNEDFDINAYPLKIDEGIIDFKEIDWIICPKNYGVIEDLRLFIKDIKENNYNNYHLIYDNSKLIDYIIKK